MNNLIRRTNNGHSLTTGWFNDFDRMFSNIFDDIPMWDSRVPAVDVRETEDGYVVEADLPGMKESDIQVQIENDLLTISSKHSEESEQKKNGYMLRERSSRSFKRSFVLPKDVDREHVAASYKSGVLSLELHKLPEAKPRTIEIKGE